MDYIKETDEVYRSQGPLTTVTAGDIAFLKERALQNVRRRVRLCAHPASEDPLHEMLIVHTKTAYIPPHKHVNKSESFHIIEGKLTVFLFDDTGRILNVISMGDRGSGRVFFYRLSSGLYHSIFPETEFVVFHEVTNGPFCRKDTMIAPWAPREDDPGGQGIFLDTLKNKIGRGEPV
jgi:cupin fold WbuC family metalloprotein